MNIKIIEKNVATDFSSESEIVTSIFKNRGIESPEDVTKELYDPMLMKGVDKAVERLLLAIKNKETISVYSDYDCDGWGSAVVAKKMLENAGAKKVNIYTNTRKIGYGANSTGVEDMMLKYPDTSLVVTTDNGIVAYDAVDTLNNLGVNVIVTDHHQPSPDGVLPNAVSVINPHQEGCTYPFKHLCGAGVAWKLMCALYDALGVDGKDEYIDIVAVSTIGDVVSLTGENRIIAEKGLSLMNSSACRKEWEIFKDVNSDFNSKITSFDAKTVAFSLVPQINACSRLDGSIKVPIEIFFTESAEKQRDMFKYIKSVNEDRKERTSDQTARAYTLVNEMSGLPAIVIYGDCFSDGLVGLIAGRIKEAYWLPTIVLAPDPDNPENMRGSGRSTPDFNLKEVLDEIQSESSLLVGYGGHSAAAGVTIARKNFDEFRKAFCIKVIEKLNWNSYKPIVIDIDITDSNRIGFVADAIQQCGPYGQNFPEPVVRIKDFSPSLIKNMGKEKEHIAFYGDNISVKCWHGADYYKKIGSPQKITAIGELRFSEYDKKYELIVNEELLIPVE